MHSLKDRVALVTGGAKGLGRHIALELAKNGAAVVIHYLKSEKEAEQTLEEARKLSKDAIKLKADVTSEREVEEMLSKITGRFGRLDILINNVGDFIYKPVTETGGGEFRHIIASNLFSAFYTCRKAMQLMKGYGRIINMGCMGCDRMTIRRMTAPYYIAKTGLWMLTKAFALECREGITVNMVSPGVLETSAVKPKAEIISFSDITGAVMFLLSESSGKVNGASIEVSGGSVLGSE